MSLALPHVWVANDDATSGNLQSVTDTVQQQMGNAPAGGQGKLDFAKLRQTVTQNLTNATWTAITFDVEDRDEANGHAAGTPSQYTIMTAPGEYQIEAGVAFAPNATGTRGLRISKNGVVTQGRVLGATASSALLQTELSLTKTITCVVGDILTIEARQDSGGTITTAYAAPEVGAFMNVRFAHT